jgi:hypothetical protein
MPATSVPESGSFGENGMERILRAPAAIHLSYEGKPELTSSQKAWGFWIRSFDKKHGFASITLEAINAFKHLMQ